MEIDVLIISTLILHYLIHKLLKQIL